MQDAASHVAAAARAEASRGISKHCVVPIHAQILSAAIKKELEPCGGEEGYTHKIRERVQVACRLHIHQTFWQPSVPIGPPAAAKKASVMLAAATASASPVKARPALAATGTSA